MEKVKTKETTKTDVFQGKTDQIVRYFEENRQKIYLASGIVVALVLLVSGWMIYRMDYEKNAQELYSQAFNYSHFAPPGVYAADQAINLYRNVVEKYPGSRSAANAIFSMGNILYRVNDVDGAIKAYDDFLRQSGSKNELRSLAYGGLGYCYEAKSKSDLALEAYEKAAKGAMAGAFLASIYSNMAGIYTDKKDQAKAVSFYRMALEQKNEPLMESMIRRKLAELDA